MKKYLLLAFSIAYSVASFSKSTKETAISPFPHFNNQSTGFINPQNNFRLVAKTTYVSNGNTFTPADSVSYYYMGQQRGLPDIYDLNDDKVMYDSSYTYIYAQGVYTRRLKRNQYYQDNKVAKLKYQSFNNNIFKDSVSYLYDYTGNIISQAFRSTYLSDGSIFNTIAYTNTLDAQGNNVIMMDGANYHIRFSYDWQNRLTTLYDFNGPIGAPIYLTKDSFIYNTNDDVYQYYTSKWNDTTNSWQPNEFWEYTYGTNAVVTGIDKKKWQNNSYKNSEKQVFSYSSTGLMVKDETLIWNAASNTYVHATQLEWTYNEFNLPTSLTSATWNGTAWTNANGDYKINFWYGIIYPTSIKTISNIEKIALYPIPAKESVNLYLEWKDLQPFGVTISDMSGRIVSQWEESKTAQYVKKIDTDNLIRGQYFLTIQTKEGEPFTQRFVVAK